MILCQKVGGHTGKRDPIVRCEQEGTVAVGGKLYCPYHAKRESKPVVKRWEPHREFVMGIPMPGLEALSRLAEDVRSL